MPTPQASKEFIYLLHKLPENLRKGFEDYIMNNMPETKGDVLRMYHEYLKLNNK